MIKGKIKIEGQEKVPAKDKKKTSKKTIKKVKLSEALENVFKGKKKIRRESWPIGCFVSMKDDIICIFLETKEYHPWVITSPDVKATDWQVI